MLAKKNAPWPTDIEDIAESKRRDEIHDMYMEWRLNGMKDTMKPVKRPSPWDIPVTIALIAILVYLVI